MLNCDPRVPDADLDERVALRAGFVPPLLELLAASSVSEKAEAARLWERAAVTLTQLADMDSI